MVIQYTRRLTFRRLTPTDASFIRAMEADQEVMRHTTGRIEPSEARRVKLLNAFASTPAAGFGHWCVEYKIKPIGWVSLTPLEATGRIQLAYVLSAKLGAKASQPRQVKPHSNTRKQHSVCLNALPLSGPRILPLREFCPGLDFRTKAERTITDTK